MINHTTYKQIINLILPVYGISLIGLINLITFQLIIVIISNNL